LKQYKKNQIKAALRPLLYNRMSAADPIAVIVASSQEAQKLEYILQNLNNYLTKAAKGSDARTVGRFADIDAFFADNENKKQVSKSDIARNAKMVSEIANLQIAILPYRLSLFPLDEAKLKKASMQTLQFEKNKNYDFENILSKLIDAGYTREPLVDEPGTFAVRGSIIDICEAASGIPYRLDFFGNELETIKEFDIFTQLSEKEPNANDLKKIEVFPVEYFFKSKRDKNDKSLLEFISRTHKIVIPDMPLISSKVQDFKDLANYYLQGKPFENHYFNWDELLDNLSDKITVVDSFQNDICYLGYEKQLDYDELLDCDKPLLQFLERIPDTFVANTEKVVKLSASINPIELETGQILVHQRYGIGKYLGLAKRYIGNTNTKYQEYIEIEYAPSGKSDETDKLLVSTSNLSEITKYIGNDNPSLSRLGSIHWKKARRDARRLARQITEQLISLYSKRLATDGFAFGPDTPAQKDFDSEFVFAETPDQVKTILDVKADMESIHPMDRLICGDVGYGKTEIAFRAAFKAVDNAKQVAILAPTTLLVSQHYQTAKKRFQNAPIRIEYLSRFQSAKKTREIIEDTKAGKVDIIIGTHKLLSDKISFYALGLAVIDEEQRFGVEQKEKLKAKNPTVDILSLSATPIPRTLEMALSGVKQLSMLVTPPLNRQPIITRVTPKSINLVITAIRSEILRGGQVFYVHNNIRTMEKALQELKRNLDSKVKIAVAHGQMDKAQLDKITLAFYNGEIDILLCTTIIETGIDIPNVNTLIIDDAQNLGLVQLHQIRGRVGRSLTQSFCYLFYDNKQLLSENAYKRLETISENVKLGSGVRIAMTDLELRGAGNFLGKEQSGKIEGVGYDLYTKMVEEALQIYKTGNVKLEKPIKLETDFDLHIPVEYIDIESLRLEVYRLIDLSKNDEEIEKTKKDINDRFGKYPLCVENIFALQRVKNLAQEKEITSIVVKGQQATLDNKVFQFTSAKDSDRLEELFNFVKAYNSVN
jgi:transcription-repair coupling factor (superfamily II helicase)